MLDDKLIEHSSKEAESQGTGYRSLIDTILRAHIGDIAAAQEDNRRVSIAAFRRILREMPPHHR